MRFIHPCRITQMAAKMGLTAGWALDLTAVDPEDKKPWDFSMKDKRDKAASMLKRDKPLMLIVNPMCGPFSALQSLFNYPKQEHVDLPTCRYSLRQLFDGTVTPSIITIWLWWIDLMPYRLCLLCVAMACCPSAASSQWIKS